MLTLFNGHARIVCQRREFLRIGGGLAIAGLVLPNCLGNRRAQASPSDASAVEGSVTKVRGEGRARACILVYLLGGPPHLDMFDLKPEAPAEIRGPFQPISSSVPGMRICEHLPRLAGIAHQYAIVRSVSHPNSNHTPMIYYTLTGRDTEQPAMDNDVRSPQRTDFPHHGAVLARFKGSPADLPGYVALPEVAVRSSTAGEYKRARLLLRGGGAGFLGPRYDPLAVNGEPGTREAVPALALPEGVSAERFEERASILTLLDRGEPPSASNEGFHAIRKRAIVLTGAANSGRTQVFSLDPEAARLRDRYGRNRFGQSLLLARRLTEAGVPMVAVHFNEMTMCDGWDTHSKNFEALKSELLPFLDRGLSALIEDLDQRGRLDETLIVCMGEFGRTPKINPNAGRDHWGDCSSTVLAGGGIRGGRVHGASDKHGAFPESDAVDPVDIQSTIYHCLGLDPSLVMYDHLNRPHAISTGRVIHELL
ncbi:MAG: DUF1501 domain-containing protein [Planctomycetes bacterium]|nr:DUF1501 domain-containing protein [Planctomycetota bacterium]